MFKFHDSSVQEISNVKNINDKDIFPDSSQNKKIKKFVPLKKKIAKELLSLENDTPVFVNSLQQYAVIRKTVKHLEEKK